MPTRSGSNYHPRMDPNEYIQVIQELTATVRDLGTRVGNFERNQTTLADRLTQFENRNGDRDRERERNGDQDLDRVRDEDRDSVNGFPRSGRQNFRD